MSRRRPILAFATTAGTIKSAWSRAPKSSSTSIVKAFRAVRRVLTDDGTLWLNLGDSYAGSWGNYRGQNRSAQQISHRAYDGQTERRPATAAVAGVPPKNLLGVPWRVAFALQADGWYLRQDIIWAKPNPMPESVTDRCTKSHEYVFLLSKSERYYFDAEAIAEPSVSLSDSQLSPVD